MSRLIKKNLDAKQRAITEKNLMMPLNQQKSFVTDFTPQTAKERTRVFDGFIAKLEHSLSDYCTMETTDGRKAKDVRSFVNAAAIETLSTLKPMDGTETYDMSGYKVEYEPEKEQPTVW